MDILNDPLISSIWKTRAHYTLSLLILFAFASSLSKLIFVVSVVIPAHARVGVGKQDGDKGGGSGRDV